jgi:uncharacterized protein
MACTRREFLRWAAAVPACGVLPASIADQGGAPQLPEKTGWAEHVPVRWVEPVRRRSGSSAVIWLSGFSGTAESMSPNLQELARAGFLAVSFDHWQHGGRGTETTAELQSRVFAEFRRRMWPILGNGVLDTSRVIDWIQSEFSPSPTVQVGGFSMGGDIAVAAAGHDTRISAVAAVVATPDWLRPGMRNSWAPGQPLIPVGVPDSYAKFFYDAFDPLTHLEGCDRAPAITFECASDDTHVPPDGALRFRDAFRKRNARAGENVRVTLHAGYVHADVGRVPVFWQESLAWFVAHA